MARAKRFATAKDSSGKSVIEFFSPAAEDDGLSVALRLLTQQLIAKGHGEVAGAGGLFGGEYGYGVDFENDVFEMHYDRQDYDCDCGASEPKHADTCDTVTKRREYFDARMDYATKKKTDAERDAEIAESVSRGMPQHMAALHACGSEIDFAKLLEYDESHTFPACSCGAEAAFVESDTHTRQCRRSIAERPNFHHKPSDLKVRWYKYIGRDNAVELGRDISLRDVLESCLHSIGVESLDVAAKEYEEAMRRVSEDHDRAMRFWMGSEA